MQRLGELWIFFYVLQHAKFCALIFQVLGNIETAKEQQKKASSKSKAKQARQCDKDLIGKPYLRPMLQERPEEAATLPTALVKDEETVSKEFQTVSDSQLEPYQLKGNHYLCYAFMLCGCLFSFILITV